MTLGGTTVGGAAVGSSGDTRQFAALPSRTLTLTRPGEDRTGETGTVGGVGIGGAAVGGTSTEPLTAALPATGFGTVNATIPSRTLTLARSVPNVLFVAGVPSRSLTLSRDSTPATGVGTVTQALPSRTLTLTRESPAFGYPDWAIDGTSIELITDESATHTTLSLVIRSERQQLIDTLRPLKSDEGKVSVRGTNAGGYRAIDRADGANSFEINAPLERTPLRPGIETYHVDRYEESLVDPNLSEWDVELDLIPKRNRTDTPSLSQTPDADEWGIETRYGEIATGRVDAEFAGTGADGVDRFDLTVRLTFEQAHVFEAGLSRLEGVRVRNIPDATNEPVDDTDDDANTVTIDAPDGQDVVGDGDYVVMEWSDSKITDAYQELNVIVSPKL